MNRLIMCQIIGKCAFNSMLSAKFGPNIAHTVVRQLSFDSLRKASVMIANSNIVESSKQNLISFHDWSGLWWSADIAIATVALRTVLTFPLSVLQKRTLARIEALSPEMRLISEKMRHRVSQLAYIDFLGKTKANLMYKYLVKREFNRLVVRDNCHPLKAWLVVWFQIPAWVILSFSIRNLSAMYPKADECARLAYQQLSDEGILWFTNLTLPDPYFALPVLVYIVNLVIIEFHSREQTKKRGSKTRFNSILTNCMRTFSLLIIPVGIYAPSGVCFYWFISSSTGLALNLLLSNENVKNRFGINAKPNPHLPQSLKLK